MSTSGATWRLKPPDRKRIPIVLAASFAMIWLISRACLQSVTIDEADAYLGYAAPPWPSHWYPASANHVLNSILVRILTHLFAPSHLTLRGPALLGAAIYIASIYRLCALISNNPMLTVPLFISLVYNPYIMDYLVAARGYGLAIGLLMAAISILAPQLPSRPPPLKACMFASACAALSFTANFAFAFVDAACLGMFFLTACWQAVRREEQSIPRTSRFRVCAGLAAACFLPAFLITLAICGSVLLNWPQGQLYFGARSLTETWSGVVEATFYELNPFVLNPLLYATLHRASYFLPPLVVVLCLLQIGLVLFSDRSRFDWRSRGMIPFGLYLIAVTLLTLLLHWLSFRTFELLLPKDRTALFFAPLSLLIFGVTTAVASGSKMGHTLHILGIILLCTGALYFVGSLRLFYFKEWKFDADVKTTFAALQSANQRYGITEVSSDWKYIASLNFYRESSNIHSITLLQITCPYPPNKRAYVLWYPEAREFIQRQGLSIIYRGELSDIVLAIRQ